MVLDGHADAKSLNSFAWGLRRERLHVAAASPALEALAAVVHESPLPPEPSRSPLKPFGIGERLGDPLAPGSGGGASLSPPHGGSPSQSRARPFSVGSSQSPPAEVAFGSGRIQRPAASQLAGNFRIPELSTTPQIEHALPGVIY